MSIVPSSEEIYEMSPAHLDDVAQLFVRVDAAHGDEPFWNEVRTHGADAARSLIDRPWHRAVCTVFNDRVVGFAALDRPRGSDIEIVRIMTDPEYTRRGIASQLVTTLVDSAEAEGLVVWLDVLEQASGAVALYESLGFVTFAAEPGTHSGRPAYQMRRTPASPNNS